MAKKSAPKAKSTRSRPLGIAVANGILPAQAIRALISGNALKLAEPLAEGQLQPASVDLRLGREAYRVRASFLPGPGSKVIDKLGDLKLHTIDLTKGAVLETGCVYIVPLLESLGLPESISASANPKSSTGRLDVFTRVIADGVTAFDQIPAGYKGPLYAEICPQTFPILARTGSKLSQLRFRVGNPREDDKTLARLHKEHMLVSGGTSDIADGIALSVDLVGGLSGLVGYRAKRHTGVVDVDAPKSCAIADYWEEIDSRGSRRLILDPDQFYILASKEAVHIPPNACRRNDAL